MDKKFRSSGRVSYNVIRHMGGGLKYVMDELLGSSGYITWRWQICAQAKKGALYGYNETRPPSGLNFWGCR